MVKTQPLLWDIKCSNHIGGENLVQFWIKFLKLVGSRYPEVWTSSYRYRPKQGHSICDSCIGFSETLFLVFSPAGQSVDIRSGQSVDNRSRYPEVWASPYRYWPKQGHSVQNSFTKFLGTLFRYFLGSGRLVGFEEFGKKANHTLASLFSKTKLRQQQNLHIHLPQSSSRPLLFRFSQK